MPRSKSSTSPVKIITVFALIIAGLGLLASLVLVSSSFDLRQQASTEAVNPNAKMYYVASTGDDTQDGSIEKPFKTLNKAVSVLKPGDTLIVKEGTYNESLENAIPSGTSWNNPVTIKAEPGASVTMLPLNQNKNDKKEIRVLFFDQDKFIVIDGINLDGKNVQYDAVRFSRESNNIKLQNLTVKNAPLQGILVQDFSHHNDFINLKVYGNGSGPGSHGIYILGSNNTVRNSWIGPNFDEGIKVRISADADNMKLTGTKIMNNTFWGAKLSTVSAISDALIANNIFYSPLIDTTKLSEEAPYPEVAETWIEIRDKNKGLNPLYQGKYVAGATIIVRQDSENIRIYNNTFVGGHPIGGGIALMERAKDVDMANNLFVNMLAGAISMDRLTNGAQSGIKFRTNLLHGTDKDIILPTKSGPNAPAIDPAELMAQISVEGTLRSSGHIFNSALKDLKYELLPGHPGIDSGLVLSEVKTDLRGRKRPRGAGIDIGAFER